MEKGALSLKTLLFWFALGVSIVLASFLLKAGSSGTRIVFCDVGQGNAAHLRVNNQIDVVIDTGPDISILNCLGKHTPFYDRKIELVIVTHPDSDHYGGLTHLIDRYEIGEIVVDDRKKGDKTFDRLKKKMLDAGILCKRKVKDDKIKLADGTITFHWPSVEFDSSSGNEVSSIFTYSERGFRLLFTGDSSPAILNRLNSRDISGIDIMVAPHHGSKNGLTERLLRLADPQVVVISVGKNNPFGHPHKTTLDLIDSKKIKIMRTDEYGDIFFNLEELI